MNKMTKKMNKIMKKSSNSQIGEELRKINEKLVEINHSLYWYLEVPYKKKIELFIRNIDDIRNSSLNEIDFQERINDFQENILKKELEK